MKCIQNLNNPSLAEMLNVGRTILLKSCDYTKYQSGVEHWRGETWVPREVYCESTYLSMPKENTPFAAMIYDQEKMKTGSHEQINEYLTFMCCFMDEDEGWAKKKATMSKTWPSKSPVATHIKNLMCEAQEMRKTLSRTPHQASL